MADKKLRAIDLYSGVGGWSRGLSMAGIDVVASYERWEAANLTNRLNNGHSTHTLDIRSLELRDLPGSIDIVVGSPPCTEFSYSNRGGGGDIKDGLRDIIKFLAIVDYLKPRWWLMENVPRVASIIEKELGKHGRLARFRHLQMATAVLDLDDYGLPQRRKRCFVGNIDFDLLRSYSDALPNPTLGDVVTALSGDRVEDPLFGVKLDRAAVSDHEAEPHLDAEEYRINEAAKRAHPVYNSMPFPDPMERAARTITATCTRVSRESVVIADPAHAGLHRRLTVRERACLQGFPITYQFYGASYGAKLRMVGNAVPPAFAFYVGHALQGTLGQDLPRLREAGQAFSKPEQRPLFTRPDRVSRQFPANRTFRFAIPDLRLKSGVRFEMANVIDREQTAWLVRFIFGNSKDICRIEMPGSLGHRLLGALPSADADAVREEVARLSNLLEGASIRRMQAVWSHKGPGTRPFEVLDAISGAGANVIRVLEKGPIESSVAIIDEVLSDQYGTAFNSLPGVKKLYRNAFLIHAGMIVGSAANAIFEANVTPHLKGPTSPLRDTAPIRVAAK